LLVLLLLGGLVGLLRMLGVRLLCKELQQHCKGLLVLPILPILGLLPVPLLLLLCL
jgi:hypothetical protein